VTAAEIAVGIVTTGTITTEDEITAAIDETIVAITPTR
jgi:glycerol-3-phosphate responsive antiterminator